MSTSDPKVVESRVFPNSATGQTTIEFTVHVSTDDSVDKVLRDLYGVSTGTKEEGPVEPDKEEAPPPPKKAGGRRRAAAKAKAEEPEKKSTGRRRRRGAAPSGPTKEDVSLAASRGAEELGADLMAEIILDYAASGKMDDIPEDRRAAFIKEIDDEIKLPPAESEED